MGREARTNSPATGALSGWAPAPSSLVHSLDHQHDLAELAAGLEPVVGAAGLGEGEGLTDGDRELAGGQVREHVATPSAATCSPAVRCGSTWRRTPSVTAALAARSRARSVEPEI